MMPYNKDQMPSTPKRSSHRVGTLGGSLDFCLPKRPPSSSIVSLMTEPSHKGLAACDSLSSHLLVSRNTSLRVRECASI